jgi:hypothetical protein
VTFLLPLKVVFACAAGPNPDRLAEAARLLMSLRWFGGTVANAKFVLGCTGTVPGEADRLFRQYGAEVMSISVASGSSSRIALLELSAIAGCEILVLLEPNTIIAADPADWLDIAGVAVRFEELEAAAAAAVAGEFSPGAEVAHGIAGGAVGAVDTGVILVHGSQRDRLAAEWGSARSKLSKETHLSFSPDRIDQISLAMTLEHSAIPWRCLPQEMNLTVPADGDATGVGWSRRHAVIIKYDPLANPSGYLRASPPGTGARIVDAFNSRLRASGHALLPAARETGLAPTRSGTRRPKVVVASGWWCDRLPHDWTIGAISSRSIAFFDVWYRQVMQCIAPERIVVTDSASPLKPDYLSYSGLQWIELDRNYGHANDVRVGAVKTRYSGFTRSVINGAMYALCCDADYYVYVEQDCLVYGVDFLPQAIGGSPEDILLGPPTQNGRGIAGAIAAPMIQQSLMVVARSGLERFLEGLLGAPWGDGERAPEETMRLRLAPFGFVQVPYGRSRPIDFRQSHYYAQHLTDDELAQFLAHAGLELPVRSFPFRAEDIGPASVRNV